MVILTVIFLLIADLAQSATIYIDTALVSDCTSGNYSIANHNCSGSDGNGYNDVLAAYNASGSNDTIYFRSTGSTHTINTGAVEGILVKQGQTWGTYPSDLPTKATVTTGVATGRIFQFENITAGTVKNLIITSAPTQCIYIAYATNIIIEDNEIADCNNDVTEAINAVEMIDCCGAGFFGAPPNVQISADLIFRRNYIHDVNVFTTGDSAYDNACLKAGGVGGQSNFLIEDNTCVNAGNGIWFDVATGAPAQGGTPHTIRRNKVTDISEYCFHFEVESTGTMTNNLGIRCGKVGVFVRAGPIGIEQLKIQNNTFYDFGNTCISFNNNDSDIITDSLVENNICFGINPTDYALTVGIPPATEATNFFRNNLIHVSGNNQGICWQQSVTGGGLGCGTGETYADSSGGISSWETACGGDGPTCSGNISGDPLFANPAGEDFRLCTASGVPHASCSGASPAINAGIDVGLPFNGSAPDIGAVETIEAGTVRKIKVVQN